MMLKLGENQSVRFKCTQYNCQYHLLYGPQSSLAPLWYHGRIYSWKQPVPSNNGIDLSLKTMLVLWSCMFHEFHRNWDLTTIDLGPKKFCEHRTIGSVLHRVLADGKHHQIATEPCKHLTILVQYRISIVSNMLSCFLFYFWL